MKLANMLCQAFIGQCDYKERKYTVPFMVSNTSHVNC
jgi:hypothetical protein